MSASKKYWQEAGNATLSITAYIIFDTRKSFAALNLKIEINIFL